MIPAAFFSGHMIAVGLQEKGPQVPCINLVVGTHSWLYLCLSRPLNIHSMVHGRSMHKSQKALCLLHVRLGPPTLCLLIFAEKEVAHSARKAVGHCWTTCPWLLSNCPFVPFELINWRANIWLQGVLVLQSFLCDTLFGPERRRFDPGRVHSQKFLV